MCSLKYFNAAQNRIERLPSTTNQLKYNCVVLEELYLQDNHLEEIAPEIFHLPSLVTLDVSNNKLQRVPYEVWNAPKLRELNVAFNLLKDLPVSRNVSAPWIFTGMYLIDDPFSERCLQVSQVHLHRYSSLEPSDNVR